MFVAFGIVGMSTRSDPRTGVSGAAEIATINAAVVLLFILTVVANDLVALLLNRRIQGSREKGTVTRRLSSFDLAPRPGGGLPRGTQKRAL